MNKIDVILYRDWYIEETKDIPNIQETANIKKQIEIWLSLDEFNEYLQMNIKVRQEFIRNKIFKN
jgi:hypothetical protein